jgi:hypothetical protein
VGFNCPDNAFEPMGEPCGDATNTTCDAADTCDGSGSCNDNLAPVGAPCGDATDDQCTEPDICNGSGTCLPEDEADGTSCTACSSAPDCVCAGGACVDGVVTAAADNWLEICSSAPFPWSDPSCVATDACRTAFGNDYSCVDGRCMPRGTHDHDQSFNPDAAAVGAWQDNEECHAAFAWDLTAAPPVGIASAALRVSYIQPGEFPGGANQSGPGDFVVEVIVFDNGNPQLGGPDFDKPAERILGSFLTSAIVPGQTFTYDVTADLQTAISEGRPSFAVMLRPATAPGDDLAVAVGNAFLDVQAEP